MIGCRASLAATILPDYSRCTVYWTIDDIETPPWASKRCVSNNSYFERDVSKPKINQ